MNRGLSKFLTLFFAACFLALQFHPVGDTQLAQNPKRIFHIEEVSASVINNNIDNRFIHGQVLQTKHAPLLKQKAKPNQQHSFFRTTKRQVEDVFRPFMQQCLAAICQSYQDKLVTTYNVLQQRELSFEFNPLLIANNKQVHTDEPDSQISLS